MKADQGLLQLALAFGGQVDRNGSHLTRDIGQVSGEPIDLVLTDVVMPRMTGPELARKIGERLRGVRVLFMSGYTEGAILESSELPQDSAFLSKPFTRDGLLAKVRELLDAR